MNGEPVTVFASQAEPFRGTVHLVVTTDQGKATLRFTPALAKIVGRELDRAAAATASLEKRPPFRAPAINHVAAVGLGLPLQKPRGGI